MVASIAEVLGMGKAFGDRELLGDFSGRVLATSSTTSAKSTTPWIMICKYV